jgi:hypothetical protein
MAQFKYATQNNILRVATFVLILDVPFSSFDIHVTSWMTWLVVSSIVWWRKQVYNFGLCSDSKLRLWVLPYIIILYWVFVHSTILKGNYAFLRFALYSTTSVGLFTWVHDAIIFNIFAQGFSVSLFFIIRKSTLVLFIGMFILFCVVLRSEFIVFFFNPIS